MLDFNEAEKVRKLFNSNEAQVHRDHAISYILSVLQNVSSSMVFFGGTALARTHLRRGRLSEDIDLYTSTRQKLCLEIDDLPNMIEQEFPQATWGKLPSSTSDVQSSLLVCNSTIQIEVQAISTQLRGWNFIPVETVQIYQRYTDIPPTSLKVPTLDGFCAMKLTAWFDRGASRDLFDLEGLTHLRPVSEDTKALVTELLGLRLTRRMLDRKIDGVWQDDLAHQTKLEKTGEECLARVLQWWGE